MYRRPKFLEILIDIRQEMAREADYDSDLFAELVRSGDTSDPEAADGPRSETNSKDGEKHERPRRVAR